MNNNFLFTLAVTIFKAFSLCGVLSTLQRMFCQLLYVRPFKLLNTFVFLCIFFSSIEYFLGIRRPVLPIVFNVWENTDSHSDSTIFLSLPIFSNIFKYLSTFLVHYQVLRLYFHGNMHHNPKILCLSWWIQILLLYRLTGFFWYHFMIFYIELFLLFHCYDTQSCKASVHCLQVALIFTTSTNF